RRGVGHGEGAAGELRVIHVLVVEEEEKFVLEIAEGHQFAADIAAEIVYAAVGAGEVGGGEGAAGRREGVGVVAPAIGVELFAGGLVESAAVIRVAAAL